MTYTDINSRAGKGSRPEANVSTKKYREGWDRIFGKNPAKSGLREALYGKNSSKGDIKTVTCTECEGFGELPQADLSVECRVCRGTGKLEYAN